MKKRSRHAQPKPLRAVQTSRHWQVVPRQHTGHLTHRRTTSYPTLVMIVLCLGVFLASWTRWVTADPFIYPGPVTNSYTVHASVPGPAPTEPAVINSPSTGAKFAAQPIGVSGGCPTNTYVTLYRNGAFSGVALCQADNTWQMQTSLFAGVNRLQARVFSPTDVPGPLSDTATVTYTPPAPPPSSGSESSSDSSETGSQIFANQPSGNSVPPAEPLIFKTDFTYQGYYTGQASTWQLALEGGTAPYAIAIDWGDGSSGLISRPRAGGFILEHTYKAAGGYQGSYTVKFSATDADGNQTFLQLLTVVNNPPAAATRHQATDVGGSSTPVYLGRLVKYVWPSYGIVVLMLTSFWLGERREYRFLKPHLKKTRHA